MYQILKDDNPVKGLGPALSEDHATRCPKIVFNVYFWYARGVKFLQPLVPESLCRGTSCTFPQVTDIIVCGHYGCGGVKAAMENKDHGLLEHWLLNIRNVQRLHLEELEVRTNAGWGRIVFERSG